MNFEIWLFPWFSTSKVGLSSLEMKHGTLGAQGLAVRPYLRPYIFQPFSLVFSIRNHRSSFSFVFGIIIAYLFIAVFSGYCWAVIMMHPSAFFSLNCLGRRLHFSRRRSCRCWTRHAGAGCRTFAAELDAPLVHSHPWRKLRSKLRTFFPAERSFFFLT